ncbi:uncharacterized protein LOC130774731 isoform X3 [Actinidia eriantha]|uniref:uncharacterized protein LOC130774731 isoform X3 n=1 Tax=Actinidia eriantha TaxID=165200 RepID=UPI002584B27C|nr:uncharacterized protein LOC130774731 isoform X3 [Actinidia eriantha]
MGTMRAMVCVFLFVSLSHLTQGNQDTEGYAAKRTLVQEEQHAHEVHCSRERSRAAAKIIEEFLMPFVEQEKYQISSTCRLHPDHDIFRDQEQNKIHVDVNEWRCGYCKKIFRAENFLDQHFDSRHYNLLNVIYVGHCTVTFGWIRIQSFVKPNAILQQLQGIATFARALLIVAFLLVRVPQQTVFMNCSCGNSVMLTRAQEDQNPFLEGVGSILVFSTWPFQY